jgi:transposase
MKLIPAGIKVHLAVGYTDMRKGLDGLAVLVEQVLEKDPFSGHMFVFRGRRADLIKVLFWDGSGLCLLAKRLEEGRFAWPVADEYGLSVTMTAAQFARTICSLDPTVAATAGPWSRRSLRPQNSMTSSPTPTSGTSSSAWPTAMPQADWTNSCPGTGARRRRQPSTRCKRATQLARTIEAGRFDGLRRPLGSLPSAQENIG